MPNYKTSEKSHAKYQSLLKGGVLKHLLESDPLHQQVHQQVHPKVKEENWIVQNPTLELTNQQEK
jgi:hypothetical protein